MLLLHQTSPNESRPMTDQPEQAPMPRDVPAPPVMLPWAPFDVICKWCVWAVYDGTECLWVDACEMRNVMMMPNFTRQAIYRKRVIFSTSARLHILATADSEVDARRLQFEFRRTFKPIGNQYFTPPKDTVPRGSGAVRCVNTGQMFKNASEAARTVGCHATTMSNHLKRRPGYSQIMGLEFKRIGEE